MNIWFRTLLPLMTLLFSNSAKLNSQESLDTSKWYSILEVDAFPKSKRVNDTIIRDSTIVGGEYISTLKLNGELENVLSDIMSSILDEPRLVRLLPPPYKRVGFYPPRILWNKMQITLEINRKGAIKRVKVFIIRERLCKEIKYKLSAILSYCQLSPSKVDGVNVNSILEYIVY